MDIGRRPRELRLAKGLSEADLETSIGITGNHIAAVEESTEKPIIDTLGACAGGLGVEMYELFLASKRDPSPLHPDSIGTLSV